MKNKSALFCALFTFLSFCIISGMTKIKIPEQFTLYYVGLIEILAFMIPAILLAKIINTSQASTVNFRLTKKRISNKAWMFTLVFALAMSLLSFLANYGVYKAFGEISLIEVSDTLKIAQDVGFIYILSAIIIPAITEEFFVRGALFSTLEGSSNTFVAMIISSLFFALLHGSTFNFIGPFICGMAYAYLTYAFGSIIPAILAHIINNTYSTFINWLSDTYGMFGIWNYLPITSLVFCLLFMYIAFVLLEKLIKEDQIAVFKKSKQSTIPLIVTSLLNPGFIALVMAYILKAVVKLF